jgi:hypothetical protein
MMFGSVAFGSEGSRFMEATAAYSGLASVLNVAEEEQFHDRLELNVRGAFEGLSDPGVAVRLSELLPQPGVVDAAVEHTRATPTI